MAGILTYSEMDGLALELLTASAAIAEKSDVSVHAVTINNSEQAAALSAAGAAVYAVQKEEIVLGDTAAVAGAITQLMNRADADVVLISSNRRGKELAGRLAQAAGAGCLTDVSGMTLTEGKIICERNALGGATVVTQYIEGKKIIAVRPRAFTPPAQSGGGSIESVDVEVQSTGVKVLEFVPKAGDSVNIEEAAILVAVGQGLADQAGLTEVQELAAKLGGEVGCSKPIATDKKWLSEERVIGLSGKKCKPELALLFGISGQVQFTVGIRDAKIIAAVNTDENAAINYLADYVIQSDMHQIIKEMNEKL